MEDLIKKYIDKLYEYADCLIEQAHEEADPMLHEHALDIKAYARKLEDKIDNLPNEIKI